MPGLGPEGISHDQPAAMTSNSQGTLLNYSISCQSEEEKTNRLLGLFLSDPRRAAVSYAAGSTGSLYKCQNPERDQGKKNHSSLICSLVHRAAQQGQQSIKPVLKTFCQL